MEYSFDINNRAFKAIKERRKRVEIRATKVGENRFDYSKLKENDIITFLSSDSRLSGIIVTHRIKEVFPDPTTGKYSFRTKGDANNAEDFALAEDYNIIGEVIFKIPKVGYIQEILATKGGLIIFIFIYIFFYYIFF